MLISRSQDKLDDVARSLGECVTFRGMMEAFFGLKAQ